MQRYVLIVIVLCSTLILYAQRPNSIQWSYVERYAPLAIQEMNHSGIPASITLAQGILESASGRSYLAVEGNNHFGIKCGNDWRGPSLRRTDDAPNECFRAYNSVEESYRDHSKILTKRQRYAFLFSYDRTDYKAWAHGLKKAGYATNPNYAYSLIGLIEAYRLYEYDGLTKHKDDYYHEAKIPAIDKQSLLGGYYQIHKTNRSYYIVAVGGETLKSLAKQLKISARKLSKYNELPRIHQLKQGEIIYLSKKQVRGDKSMRGKPYVVQAGDSMHSIAQRYAIRLKSLYKLNGLSPEDTIAEGDLIWLW